MDADPIRVTLVCEPAQAPLHSTQMWNGADSGVMHCLLLNKLPLRGTPLARFTTLLVRNSGRFDGPVLPVCCWSS